jgi:DNA polymerase-3 subunit delta
VQNTAADWPPGVTLFFGADRFHLQRAWSELTEALVPEGSGEFALSSLGAEGHALAVEQVIAEAGSMGMFAPVKVVRVLDAGLLDGEPDRLLAFAAQPPQGCYLLVRAESLDQRRKLHKALLKCGTTLEFAPPSDREQGRWFEWVKEMAAERGLALGREAAGYLLAVTRGDGWAIDAELAKLQAWQAGTKDSITLDTVKELAAGSAERSSWAVADALLDRDRARALDAMRTVLVQGEEPIRLLGGIASRSRAMLQAAGLQAAGCPKHEIVKRVRAWYYKDRLFPGIARYSEAELLRFPAILLEADRALKSGGGPAHSVMENLVERMVAGR